MHSYLKNDLWLKLANKANVSAKILADKLKVIPNCKIKYEVEANSVFAYLTKEQHESAIKNGAKYYFGLIQTN